MDYYCEVSHSNIEKNRLLMISDPGLLSTLREFRDSKLFIEATIGAPLSREIDVASVEIGALIREGKSDGWNAGSDLIWE